LYGLMEVHGFATDAAKSGDGAASIAETTTPND
jgi:hypothetical protein